MTVFVQLYESNTEAVKSEVATFLEVFPEGLIFGNTHMGAGYDVVLVGQKTPAPIDVDAIQARLSSPEYAQVAYSLSQIGFNSAVDLMSTFAARAEQLRPWLADAQINLDKNLRLQYLAGFGLNLYEQATIYAGMIQQRHYPEGLFTGSPETIAALRGTHSVAGQRRGGNREIRTANCVCTSCVRSSHFAAHGPRAPRRSERRGRTVSGRALP